jgi:Fe-S-cluster containining protein
MAAVGEQSREGETIQVGKWRVELRLATGRIEGGGPLNVAEECGGHCCRHGVYASLPERERILEYSERVQALMDRTQTTDTSRWFEDNVERDEDYPGGLCVGTATYEGKCVFLNSEGLCILQALEPSLGLREGERLKPFYCRLFPLVTSYDLLEFDDLCDGVRPCCTLASDGQTLAIDAYAYEFKEVLGASGYEELRRRAEALEAEQVTGRSSG